MTVRPGFRVHVAALATAVAIVLVIALRAPTGNGTDERLATHSAPAATSASELPVMRGEPELEPTGAASVQARADVGSEPSSRPDEVPVASPRVETSLSAQEVRDLFLSGDVCLMADSALGAQRCKLAAVLAELIVLVPKSSTDAWAYGMEYELNRQLTELLDADDQRLLKRREVHCNAVGCLVYVDASGSWPGRFERLAAQIRSDPDIAELNRHGKWPGAGTWSHGRYNSEVINGAMLVLPR